MSEYRYDFQVKPNANPKSIVAGDHWRFTVLTDGLLRFEWTGDKPGEFEDRASTFAINRDFPVPEFQQWEKNGYLNIRTSRFHVIYNKKAFTESNLLVRILGGITRHHSEWRYGQVADGFGGTARTLDGVDGRIEVGPGVVSSQGYAAINDSRSMLFDGSGWVGSRQGGAGRVDGYLFAYAHDYRGAIRALYGLSGKQPLLPRWSLGNWWSRYYAYNADEYTNLMDRFKKEGIPMNVAVIDMDWHWVHAQRVKDAGMSGWTGYSWDKALFPDPKHFCKGLHDRNLKITLNDHPADGVASYEDAYQEMAKALGHDTSNGEAIDFDSTDRKFLDAYFDILLRRLENDGCDFWWVDWQSGPFSRIKGTDPLWMLNHYHFLNNKVRDKNAPLVFSRYAGPGSHRYPVGFSGDTVTTWNSLDFQPEFTATASNIGYGWWSHDIGGHMHGYRDDELVARWVQLGVFSPIMRLHSTQSLWMSKEPWLYGIQTEMAMKEMLRFRHRMLPYLHTMNVRATREDEPLVQPMYWTWPERKEAIQFKNQFYFGSELLVTPITSPQDPTLRLGTVKAWLPPGRHVDIFTGAVYDGDRVLDIYRSLNHIPVLASCGSIVPLDHDPVPGNGSFNPSNMELLIVVGEDARFTIIEDDASGNAASVNFSITFNQRDGTLHIAGAPPSASPATRKWWLNFAACYFDEHDLRITDTGSNEDSDKDKGSELLAPSVTRSAYGTMVELGSLDAGSSVTVSVGRDPQLRIADPGEWIRGTLMDAQIEFGVKQKIWDVVERKDVTRISKASQLEALEMPRGLRAAVLEALLADSRGG
ncbi:MAG: hypothetical protein LQ340_007371 [Diploschistes diacapsis]|nr:MAG: hypothetical protein LQ340_007371 [Diploschistes diacapsis]